MCDAMTGKRAGNQYATWKKCMDSQRYYKWETASRCEVKVNGPTSGSATSAADPNLLETVKAVAGWQRIVLWILRVDQQRIKDLEAIKHWRVRRQEAAEEASTVTFFKAGTPLPLPGRGMGAAASTPLKKEGVRPSPAPPST